MQADKDLVRRIEAEKQHVLSNLQEKLDDLLQQYDVACLLSQGPNVSRAEYWTGKAKDAECDLRIELKRLDLACDPGFQVATVAASPNPC